MQFLLVLFLFSADSIPVQVNLSKLFLLHKNDSVHILVADGITMNGVVTEHRFPYVELERVVIQNSESKLFLSRYWLDGVLTISGRIVTKNCVFELGNNEKNFYFIKYCDP